MAEVDILLPDGQAATVPEQDLGRALAAGAQMPKTGPSGPEGEFWNSGAGQVLTAGLGAARTASFGLSDNLLAEGANIISGESSRKEALHTLSQAKEINPYADLAGEVGGLFIGGGGITQAGEMAESAIAARAGEGLAGKLAAGGVRGFVEGGLLGAEHSLTEDTLGDHAINGEKMFATMGKEGLLGAAGGAAISGAGYGLGRALGLGVEPAVEASVEGGRLSKTAIDDVAGLKGAGNSVKSSMQHAEETIEALQKTGLTSEQAAELADKTLRAADKLVPEKGNLPGLIDKVRDAYIGEVAGTTERAAILKRGYELQSGLREAHEDVLRNTSAELSKDFTKVARKLEDSMNDIQFTEKTDQMRKLIGTGAEQARLARDHVAGMFQQVSEKVLELDSLFAKGGSEGALKRIIKESSDLSRVFQRADADAADFMTAGNKLKQLLDRHTDFSTKFKLTEGEQAFKDLRESIKVQLEDTTAFGRGGEAQARLNSTYSELVPRRSHLAQTVGQTIDRGDGGVTLLGGDFQKFQSMMRSLTGDATDAEIEGVKSVEGYIDGMRARAAAVKDFGHLSPKQAADIAEGEKALDAFAQNFAKARTDIAANNKLRAMQLMEREAPRMGGLVGMIGDVITKPLTTMERLAEIRSSTVRLDKAIDKGLQKAFEFKASATKATAATRQSVENEIGQFRELAGNPEALADRARKFSEPLSKVAPKIAQEAAATAMRALNFLATEAPIPLGSRAIMGMPTRKPRYSDEQVSAWQNKREAALGAADGRTAPEVIIGDLQKGRLNRDAIRTIEFVSPQLFLQLQQTAQRQISQMAADGKLDKLTLAQQASIASLLKVPPGKMWEPDFMLLMQSAKSIAPGSQSQSGPPSAPNQGTSKRAIKVDTSAFQTETQAIEAR